MGGPSVPTAPTPPPAPAPPPTLPSGDTQGAVQNQKNIAVAAVGPAATILTGPQGLTSPATTTAKQMTGS